MLLVDIINFILREFNKLMPTFLFILFVFKINFDRCFTRFKFPDDVVDGFVTPLNDMK